jgi:hypothetical protein
MSCSIVLFAAHCGFQKLLAFLIRGCKVDHSPDCFTLSEDDVNEFLSRGIVVVRDVLSPEEVNMARRGMHDRLLRSGVSSAHWTHF